MLAYYLTRTIQERFKLALKVFIDIRNILYQYLNRQVFLSHTEMLSLSFFHPGSYLVALLVFITLKRSYHNPQFIVKSINSYTLFCCYSYWPICVANSFQWNQILSNGTFKTTNSVRHFLAQPKLFGLKLHVERVKTKS